MVGDADYSAGVDIVGGDDIGAVDPGVSSFQAGGTARRNLHGWKVRGSGGFWHAVILNAWVVTDAAGWVEPCSSDSRGDCPHTDLQLGETSLKTGRMRRRPLREPASWRPAREEL